MIANTRTEGARITQVLAGSRQHPEGSVPFLGFLEPALPPWEFLVVTGDSPLPQSLEKDTAL